MRLGTIAVSLTAACLVPQAAVAQQGGQGPLLPVAPLFADYAVLELRLVAPLTSVLGERGEERNYRNGTLTYGDPDAGLVTLDVEVRTRGNFRARPENCDFPPLRLNLEQRQVEGTVFAGLDKLRLVTHCRDGDAEYEQYVLREYLVYRVFSELTELSIRARLARITYVDSEDRRDEITRFAFFVEDYGETARRNGWELLAVPRVLPGQYDQHHLSVFEVFQYLIANTDWSVIFADSGSSRCCHNAVPVGSYAGPVFPLPFDFDFAGLVAARYARADSRFGARPLPERRFWGICRGRETLEGAFPVFNERRDAIYRLYREAGALEGRYRDRVLQYFDEFYGVINDPDKVERELVGRCREATVR